MGALGSDAAIEAADVVLMDDDPLKSAKPSGSPGNAWASCTRTSSSPSASKASAGVGGPGLHQHVVRHLRRYRSPDPLRAEFHAVSVWREKIMGLLHTQQSPFSYSTPAPSWNASWLVGYGPYPCRPYGSAPLFPDWSIPAVSSGNQNGPGWAGDGCRQRPPGEPRFCRSHAAGRPCLLPEPRDGPWHFQQTAVGPEKQGSGKDNHV